MFMSIFLIIQLVIFNFITRTGADRLLTGNVACRIRNLGRFCLWNQDILSFGKFFPFLEFFFFFGGGGPKITGRKV